MKKYGLYLGIMIIIGFIGGISAYAQNKEEAPLPTENFYNKSLHFTNKGFEYLYAKEQGGLERLTGLTVTEMGCIKAKCHVQTCDACHKKEVNGKTMYSVQQAQTEEACKRCHPVDKNDPDLHFKKGMKCMDCHSSREIHGDGVAYNTYMEPGVFDTRCENCHASIKQSASHTVHKGKLDCTTCHVKDFPVCFNCHVETRLKEGKDVQLLVNGSLFLVNHDGKVTLANFLSYVYKNKTMLTFAPYFSHSIKKEGRKCSECHNSPIIQAIKKNNFVLATWEKNKLKNATGVIPVLDGMKWNLVYFNYENGKWIPLQNPAAPLINYSGFCSPLTREQFSKLEKIPATK